MSATHTPHFQLHWYFPDVVGLAIALEITVAQVYAWDEGRATGTDDEINRLLLLAGLCQEIRPFMQCDARVGDWLLTQHPGLGGTSPVWALRDPDPDATYDRIIDLTGRADEIKAARNAVLRDVGGHIPPEILARIHGTARPDGADTGAA